MDLQVAGKVAMITGGSEGIGLAAAKRLALEGARVAIVARTPEKLERAAAEIEQATGGRPLAISADVSTTDGCNQAVEQVIAAFGRLDILVNNAGSAAASSFEQVSEETWQYDIDLKVQAAIRCSRAAVPHLKAAGGGAIVNVLSIGGKTPGAGSMPSSVTRAAGLGLTKAMSKDLGVYGIRVNAVCIGRIRSGQIERGWQRSAPHLTWEEYSRDQGKAVPLGRLGEAEEAANVIAFLVSGAASYVTGTAVNIDGGASAVL